MVRQTASTHRRFLAMIPALTTVDVEHERLGRHVMTQLLAAIRGTTPPEDHGTLTRIVWRESTGPAPGLGGQARR